MNKKGLSLTELMVALPLVAAVFGIILGTYVTMQKLFPAGVAQVTVQSSGRNGLERIASNLRLAINADVQNNGNTINITLDPNLTYNSGGDDIIAQYVLNGTTIVYDPDTTVSGDEVNLLEDVQSVTGIPLFQKSGNLIVVTFKLVQNNILFGTQSCTMATSVRMRSDR